MVTENDLKNRIYIDITVSLIIPVFNEEDAIPLFVETTSSLFAKAQFNIEMIFVNDGSTDSTLSVLLNMSNSDPRIRIINLSRNFGKESALSAGLATASGDVVVPIDVDLQDPPELIIQFLEKWCEGYDVVYGIRSKRDSDSRIKRLTSGCFYKLFNTFSKLQIPENVGDYRLIDRRVVEILKQLPERNRFMKGLFAWVGFRSIGIPYERPLRAAGVTKWNYWRLWNFALDGFFAFSSLPLRIWSYIGGIVALFAFVYTSFIVIRVLFLGIDVPGYASLISIILFIGGIQLLSVGVLGEYIGRLFEEVKGRPVFVVEGIYHDGIKVTCEAKK